MKRCVTVIGLAFVAAVVAGAIGVANAAAIEWLVSTAGKVGKLTMTSGETKWVDESTKQTSKCGESSRNGPVNEGLTGADIGEIEMASWNKGLETCESEGIIKFTYALNALTLTEPWLVLAVTDENGGDLVWLLFHTHLVHLTSSSCSYLLSGLTIGLWHQASQLLLFSHAVNLAGKAIGLTSDLLTSNASGCLGAVVNGDANYFEGTYKPSESLTIKKATNGEWLVSTAGKVGKLTMTSGETKWVDESTKQASACGESSRNGPLDEGLVTGSDIGKVEMASWNKGLETCSSEGIIRFTFAVNALTLTEPWLVLAVGDEGGSDLVWLLFHTHVTHLTSSSCSYLLSGLVIGLWHQKAQVLLFGMSVNLAAPAGLVNDLLTSNVSGCLGAVNNGDLNYFEGTYKPSEELTIKLGP